MNAQAAQPPAILQWTAPGRALIFLLAATSIWCLLAEMYGLCDMRTFALFILLPATALLYGIALFDRARGDGRLWRAVMLGTLAGLIAALAYDVFRLPFVFANQWRLAAVVPPMPLFKVFPRFGAMLLNQPLEQQSYSLAAHLWGWAYHFSNGATFGVMFAAMIGEARSRRGAATIWAILMAVGIELCLLLSPYAKFFGITMTPRFVGVTLAAHLIFGLVLGLFFAWHSRHWNLAGGGLRGRIPSAPN